MNAIARLPAASLRSVHQPVAPLVLVADRGGLICSRVIEREACAAIVEAVRAARDEWTPSFDATQLTLGRAYYTHLEEDHADDYFRRAAESNALVERVASGMSARLLGLLRSVLRADVRLRPGWCGPGIHIFPSGAWVAERGGEIHFDTEGLTDEQLSRRAPALSVVLGLQMPEHDGGTRLWNTRYEGVPDVIGYDEPAVARLLPGDALIFDSYRLHQIEPFAGDRDRVSATVHAVQTDGEHWEAWF